jgi:hypothetical protein
MKNKETLTTKTFNFDPDESEKTWIAKAVKGDWDAKISLAYRNILYDTERAMWVRVPEEDFDRRRSNPRNNKSKG